MACSRIINIILKLHEYFSKLSFLEILVVLIQNSTNIIQLNINLCIYANIHVTIVS